MTPPGGTLTRLTPASGLLAEEINVFMEMSLKRGWSTQPMADESTIAGEVAGCEVMTLSLIHI